MAYIAADIHWTIFMIGYDGSDLWEFLWHHASVMIGGLSAFMLGRWNLTLSAMILIVETSNFFMNMRWHYQKHKWTDHWSFMPICICFLISFFLTRVVYMGMINVRTIEMGLVHFDVMKELGPNWWYV